MTEEKEKVYRPRELAKELGIPAQTVYTWIRTGKIKVVRIGGSIIIKKSDVLPLLKGIDL